MSDVGSVNNLATPATAPAASPVSSSSAVADVASQQSAAHTPPAGGQTHGLGVDEQTLDKIAQRLMKRDPGLLIEKDDVLRSYVYKFLDSDSGQLVRQFPAESVLSTMRALQQIDDGQESTQISAGVEA